MSLHAIVAALGGDLYHNGCRANVPAPGHSAADRSVSLLLSEGRVVIHGFGGEDWRSVRDHLRERGFIDHAGRLTGGGRAGPSTPRPDPRLRVETASRLWSEAGALDGASAADRYLRRRAVPGSVGLLNLGCHRHAPVSVYRPCGRTRPALIARISDDDDRLTAVELSYLEANGRPASSLRLTRKTVGRVPAGAAVRLSPPAEEMLAAEGVITTLSAMNRFRLPGWALMSAHNLAQWTPPAQVRRILIAADRGPVGETAAARLRDRLVCAGLWAQVAVPDPPFGDWNEAVPPCD